MNNTSPLTAINELVANPKQVIDDSVNAAMKSVFRCRTITHSLARWIDEKSKKAEDRVDAIAAPYSPRVGEVAIEPININPMIVPNTTTNPINIVNLQGFSPACKAV